MSRLEVFRLWLSYQRYSFLLWGTAALIVAVPLWFAPDHWYIWCWPAGYFAFKFTALSVIIWYRWRKKLRATIVADRRIRRGSFEPVFVKQFCGDPCFRVVANEVLRRAGYNRRDRWKRIADFERERRSTPNVVVLVDRSKGVTILVDGTEVSPDDIDSINQGA